MDKKTYKISLYGKDSGRAGMENKYELPPPVDNILFFGKIALVNDMDDLTIDLWNKIYEQLFGGFFDPAENPSQIGNAVETLCLSAPT